jgi:hypothetical protein
VEGFGISCDEDDSLFLKDQNIKGVIEKVQKLAVLFKRSPLKNDKLQEHVKMSGMNEKSLILDSKTRWSSLYEMCERFTNLKIAIQKTLIDLNLEIKFTENDFKLIEEISKCLKPVKMMVEMLCKRESNLITANSVLEFTINELKCQGSKLSNEMAKSLDKRCFIERISEVFKLVNFLNKPKNNKIDFVKTIDLCSALLERLNLNEMCLPERINVTHTTSSSDDKHSNNLKNV